MPAKEYFLRVIMIKNKEKAEGNINIRGGVLVAKHQALVRNICKKPSLKKKVKRG